MSSSPHSQRGKDDRDKRRVYVTGYSSKEDQHEMKKLFKKFGKIEEFSWKGKFCFIQYEEADDANKAVKKMNKENLNDYSIVAEIARSQKRGDGACYSCGKKGHFARNCRNRRSESSSRDRKKKRSSKRRGSSSSSRSSSPKKKRSSRKAKKASTSRSRSRGKSSSRQSESRNNRKSNVADNGKQKDNGKDSEHK